jgi:acyl-CoA synthetase (AMP-forming)/AMP-acid ligase II
MVFMASRYVRHFPTILHDVINETKLNEIIHNSINGHHFGSGIVSESQVATIIFTSGSTGEPKGVMLSHKNLIANTESIISYLNITEKDIIHVVLPFFYCYGLSLLHTHARVGASLVITNSFVFLATVIHDLSTYKCTGFAGVPSHFQILLRKSKDFKNTPFPHLRYVTQAGGKLHNSFIEEFVTAFPEIDFYVMYGQTEATARLSYLPPYLLKEKLGSIGKGIPGVNLEIVNHSGEPVSVGEVGEIVAKGDNIMLGYFDDPEMTRTTIVNTWLHTGDLGKFDDEGFIFVTGRKKDIIKVGGNRLSSKEIEEVVLEIPYVIDCTISSIHDDLWGESIKAEIVVNNKDDISPEYVREYCSKKLMHYKVPQVIEVKTEMKLSSSGKKVKV